MSPVPPIGLPTNDVPDTEVELLKAIVLALDPAQSILTMPDTEIPLLKLWLSLI